MSSWVFLGVGCPEAELSYFREIKASPGCFQAGRPTKAIQDGQFHIGPAQLCQHRRIGHLHHRMDDALGMNHDFDVVVIKSE